ncbi:MAG: hypothetical protein ACRDPT_02190 [Streptomycetales bacterium]
MVRNGALALAERFSSRLHDERVASWLGIALGTGFLVCFVTGVFSHFMRNPPEWLWWPSRPVGSAGQLFAEAVRLARCCCSWVRRRSSWSPA